MSKVCGFIIRILICAVDAPPHLSLQIGKTQRKNVTTANIAVKPRMDKSAWTVQGI